MIRHLILLIGGSLVFGTVLAVPAARWWGPAMYTNAAVAGGLCLLPTVVILLGAGWLGTGPHQMLLVLGANGLRMFLVLSVAMVLSVRMPYFAEQEPFAFWGWILVFYLFTLTLEIVLLAGRRLPARAGFPCYSFRSG